MTTTSNRFAMLVSPCNRSMFRTHPFVSFDLMDALEGFLCYGNMPFDFERTRWADAGSPGDTCSASGAAMHFSGVARLGCLHYTYFRSCRVSILLAPPGSAQLAEGLVAGYLFCSHFPGRCFDAGILTPHLSRHQPVAANKWLSTIKSAEMRGRRLAMIAAIMASRYP